MEQSNTVDITAENFQQIIVDSSMEKLVVIGFWTARDPGCVDLMERIEAITGNHADSVIFAKIDVDSQMQIAMQFGIQSVPTVALFKEAKPVDSFVGSKEQAELEAFLQPHLPKEEDALLAQARQLLSAGDGQNAYGVAKKAYELDNERADIKLVFADANIQSGKLDVAEALLGEIRMLDQDGYYQSLVSALELAQNAADSPEIQALQQQLEQAPQDNEIKVKLAVQLSQAGRNEEALVLLFEVLKKDMAFGEARKIYLDILATLPEGDSLAPVYRRKIYSLMY